MTPPTIDELRAIRDAIDAERAADQGASTDRRRTAQQKRLIVAGIHPATSRPLLDDHEAGPVTCGDCVHAHRYAWHNRSFWKCDLHRLGESHSAASDIRKSWPACTLYEPRTEGTTP